MFFYLTITKVGFGSNEAVLKIANLELMIALIDLKKAAHTKCIELVNVKIDTLNKELSEASNAMEGDTKSSAGDKYETGREMIQQELNKLNTQKNIALKELQTLKAHNPLDSPKSCQLGALVDTKSGIYYLTIPLGKIEVKSKDVFIISPISPIGQALIDLKKGDHFVLRNNKSEILEIA